MDPNTTYVHNIKCNLCGRYLPPHTMKEHLDVNNPILICPHIVNTSAQSLKGLGSGASQKHKKNQNHYK